MAIRTGIIFCTLLLGCLAIPVPNEQMDMSIFFDSSDPDSSRIVGGNVAANGAHPWAVSFTLGGTVRSAHCGGSIINQRTILTAAHCIVPVRQGNSVRSDVRVNAGTNQLTSGGQSLPINWQSIHPQYNANTIKNDVGTMRTSSNIVFNNVVRAISLSSEFIGANVASRVAGWGRTGATLPPSQQLLQIDVPTMDGQTCVREALLAAIRLNMFAPAVNPNLEICTFHSTGRGTCRGDSGSALVRVSNSQQIGIVSWGFPCALGAPDMYVRVSTFIPWIRENTW